MNGMRGLVIVIVNMEIKTDEKEYFIDADVGEVGRMSEAKLKANLIPLEEHLKEQEQLAINEATNEEMLDIETNNNVK